MRKIWYATHARGRGARLDYRRIENRSLHRHPRSQLYSAEKRAHVISHSHSEKAICIFRCQGFIRSAFFIYLNIKVAKMAASPVSFLVFTIFWGVVGIVLPFLVPKGPNRGVLQAMLMLTAATCWLFWLCCYMAQMNPLIGPKLTNHTLLVMAREWGNPI